MVEVNNNENLTIEIPDNCRKYIIKINEYIRILQISDEMLFQGIIENTNLVFGYVKNLKEYADEYKIGSMESVIFEIRQSLRTLETSLNEAIKRANENR